MIRYYIYRDEIGEVYCWVVGSSEGDCDDPLTGTYDGSLSADEMVSVLVSAGVDPASIQVDN